MLIEILALVGLGLAIVTYVSAKALGKRALWAAGALAVAPMASQLAVNGYYWQMVPAYAAAGVLAVIIGRRLVRQPSSNPGRQGRVSRVAGSIGQAGIAALVVASALSLYGFPIFHLPDPTGPYQVGTTRMHLVDEDRRETFADDPAARRELMVQAWYPADAAPDAVPAPALHEGRMKTRSLLSTMGMPPFLFDHVAQVRSHSYRDAPLAASEDTYPVLVFSHGYGGLVDQNVIQMQELASHGYIVVSISHPYEAQAVVFPDGRLIEAAPMEMDQDTTLFDAWQAAETLEERVARAKAMLEAGIPMADSVHLWAEDTVFVLDQLESLNHAVNGHLGGRMDLARLGLFGHSFGGATAGQVCLIDDRPLACLNMDGAPWGDMVLASASKPTMFVGNQDATGLFERAYERAQGPAYLLYIEGTGHLDFSDQPYWTPLLRLMGMTGSIGGKRANEVMNAYTLAFFDRYLKGLDVPLLDGPSADFPEVQLDSNNELP